VVMVILITCVIAGHPRLATVAPPKLAAYFPVFLQYYFCVFICGNAYYRPVFFF